MRLGGRQRWCLSLGPARRLCLTLFGLLLAVVFFAVLVADNDPIDEHSRPTPLVAHSSRPARRVIPRILHQSYRSRRLPPQYWASVASWHRTHPDYTYFLWTDADIDRFIRNEYPLHASLFAAYSHQLQRVDAVRYFILYHYGGVYADMDVTALRSMDPLLARYSCVISRERYEQSWFLWGRREVLMNAMMASAPRHPFMKFVILNLRSTARPSAATSLRSLFGATDYILTTTGPIALTNLFYRYRPCQRPVPRTGGSHACDVYAAAPHQLLPRVKPQTLDSIRYFCSAWWSQGLLLVLPWRRRACQELERNGYSNDVPADAYTDHQFSNLGYGSVTAARQTKDIVDLVGPVRRYST